MLADADCPFEISRATEVGQCIGVLLRCAEPLIRQLRALFAEMMVSQAKHFITVLFQEATGVHSSFAFGLYRPRLRVHQPSTYGRWDPLFKSAKCLTLREIAGSPGPATHVRFGGVCRGLGGLPIPISASPVFVIRFFVTGRFRVLFPREYICSNSYENFSRELY